MHMLRRQGTNWLVKARSAVDNDSSRHVAWSELDSGGGRGYPGGRPAVGHARNRQPAKMHERTAACRSGQAKRALICMIDLTTLDFVCPHVKSITHRGTGLSG